MSPATVQLLAHLVLSLAVMGSGLALAFGGQISGGEAIAVVGGAAGLGGVGTLGSIRSVGSSGSTGG